MDNNLKLFLLLFRFTGLSKASNSNNKCFWTINVVSIVIIVVLLSVCYVEREEIYHTGSFIGFFLDVIQVVLPIVGHLTIILEAIFKHNIDESMRDVMTDIEIITEKFTFRSLVVNRDLRTKFFWIWFIFIGFILFTVIPEFWVFGSGWRPFPGWIESIAIRFWSNQIQKINLIYFLALMVFIQNTIYMCRKELKHGSDDFQKRIDTVKKCLILHFHLEGLIQKRFSWSLVLFIINDFISMTIGLYFIITRIYYGGSDLIGLEGILFELVLKELSKSSVSLKE